MFEIEIKEAKQFFELYKKEGGLLIYDSETSNKDKPLFSFVGVAGIYVCVDKNAETYFIKNVKEKLKKYKATVYYQKA